MTWKCLERRVNTSCPEVRATCIYTFLHLYSISENLPEEFVSLVVLSAETEACLMEHEQISVYYDVLDIFPVKSLQGTVLKPD